VLQHEYAYGVVVTHDFKQTQTQSKWTFAFCSPFILTERKTEQHGRDETGKEGRLQQSSDH